MYVSYKYQLKLFCRQNLPHNNITTKQLHYIMSATFASNILHSIY